MKKQEDESDKPKSDKESRHKEHAKLKERDRSKEKPKDEVSGVRFSSHFRFLFKKELI